MLTTVDDMIRAGRPIFKRILLDGVNVSRRCFEVNTFTGHIGLYAVDAAGALVIKNDEIARVYPMGRVEVEYAQRSIRFSGNGQ